MVDLHEARSEIRHDDGDQDGGGSRRRDSDAAVNGVALVDHVNLPAHAEAVVGLIVDEFGRARRHRPVHPTVFILSSRVARKF